VKKAPLPPNEKERLTKLYSYEILDTPNEKERLTKLYSYEILDTPNEEEFDRIARLVATICGTRQANISLVDKDRQWFKAIHNMTDKETPRDLAFCAHTILDDQVFIIPNALEDERFHDNPLVTKDKGVRFYAGMPLITPEGYRIGSLCAIDTEPRTLSQDQIDALEILSTHVVNHLELRAQNKKILAQQQRIEKLSEQKSRLLSILVHDLRSPLANVAGIVSMFQEMDLEENEKHEILEDLKQLLTSSHYLIENVVQWAGRKSSDGSFEFEPIDLYSLFEEITKSLTFEFEQKENQLHWSCARGLTVVSDRSVLVFVLRNLLMNANKFTSKGTVALLAINGPESTQVRIKDTGIGMTPEQLASLFQWENRRRSIGTRGEKGSGLALLFCDDLIRRLEGKILVESTSGEGSVFTVELPHRS